MIVGKVINNNVISVIENNVEKIIMGRGIGFKKKKGDIVEENKIEKIFIIENEFNAIKFKELMANIPMDCMLIADDIIIHAKKNLKRKFSDLLYINLADHIDAAINRVEEGITIKNLLIIDVKRFYPEEFELGKYGLNIINNKFGVSLPEDEAGFIALHIVNAEEKYEDKNEVIKMFEIIHLIEDIVRNEYNVIFDESNVYYFRFLTHLKFFAERLLSKGKYNSEKNLDYDLFDTVIKKYKEANRCVGIIKNVLNDMYGYDISVEEEMYLTLHVQRLISLT